MDSEFDYVFDSDGDTLLIAKKFHESPNELGCEYILDPKRKVSIHRRTGKWTFLKPLPEMAGAVKEDPKEEEKVKMKVSSKHLKQASPHFKKELSQPCEFPRKSGELIVYEAPKIDFDILLELMDIIHGRDNLVRKEMPFLEMMRFAVAMDYFQCLEVCSTYTEIWADRTWDKLFSNDWDTLTFERAVMATWLFRKFNHSPGANFYMQRAIERLDPRPIFFLPQSKDLLGKILYKKDVS